MSIAENLTETGAPSAPTNAPALADVAPVGVDQLLGSTESVDAIPYIFVDTLMRHAPWQIARILSRECGDDFSRIVANIKAIKLLTSESFHDEVANSAFGDKLAGDLGIRSTQSHPKTDYGQPKFGSGWDLDER